MKLRTILIAAGAPLLVLMVLRPWAGDAAPDARPASAAVPRPAVGAFPAGRDRAVDGVRAELAELRADVSRLGPAPAPAPAEAEEPEPEELRARDDQRSAAKAALLARTFAADARDPSWSPQAERAVRDAFAAAALPGARLDEAACGATLCRVAVVFDSIEHRNDGYGGVIELVRWPSRGFGRVSPDDPLRYVFYASRDQASFPRVE
jgi:hypothetical protein